MTSTLLAAFEHKTDAENLHHFLELSGVKSAVADLTVEKPGNFLPLEFAKYQVRVAEGEQENALKATRQTAEGTDLIMRAVRCPECGSCRVIYPNQPHNFLVPAFFRLLIKLRLLEGSYHCLLCKHEWPPAKH